MKKNPDPSLFPVDPIPQEFQPLEDWEIAALMDPDLPPSYRKELLTRLRNNPDQAEILALAASNFSKVVKLNQEL